MALRVYRTVLKVTLLLIALTNTETSVLITEQLILNRTWTFEIAKKLKEKCYETKFGIYNCFRVYYRDYFNRTVVVKSCRLDLWQQTDCRSATVKNTTLEIPHHITHAIVLLKSMIKDLS